MITGNGYMPSESFCIGTYLVITLQAIKAITSTKQTRELHILNIFYFEPSN